MTKNKDQKRKEREKRVTQKKLAEAAKRRETARQKAAEKGGTSKVITAGVRQHSELKQVKTTPDIRKP